LFIYLAPVLVVVGARWFLPGDRFSPSQWLGLALSFAGIALAFGLPAPVSDPRQMVGDLMMLCAAASWAATTLVIKASTLNNAPFEKTSLYQLVISVPILALAALAFGERVFGMPSSLAMASLTYQSLWVASISFVVWFALVQRYSASRLSAFTFLTPLFGVAAGNFVLDEPLTPAFTAAVAFVVTGLVLVNRPR
jgi:drug/metabolite transporter (DMT)-like permease